MAWCDTCDRVVTDNEAEVGECERCHNPVTAQSRGPMPWKFRFMIAATVVYLVWRLYQGIQWLMH